MGLMCNRTITNSEVISRRESVKPVNLNPATRSHDIVNRVAEACSKLDGPVTAPPSQATVSQECSPEHSDPTRKTPESARFVLTEGA